MGWITFPQFLKNRVESGREGRGFGGQSRRKQASPLTCVLHISLPSVNLLSLAAKSGEPGVAASLGCLK